MGGRYNNTTVVHKVQTGGEITVNLVLTIKLEGNNLQISSAEATPLASKKLMKEYLVTDDEDTELIVPEIQSFGMIQFGKKVEED